MDSNQQLLSLISKFPNGIRGIDLRFALRVHPYDFRKLVHSSLVEHTITLDNLTDFEQGRFKLSASLYFEQSIRTPVSKIIADIHETLQRNPQGLNTHELHNKTHYPVHKLEQQLFVENELGFLQVQTDENFRTKYCTSIQEPISRLIEIEPTQLPTIYNRGTVLSIGSIGTFVLILLSKIFFF